MSQAAHDALAKSVENLRLVFPRQTYYVKELIVFEEPDPTVGLFSTFIEVSVKGIDEHFLLNEGHGWVHPFKEDDEPDWDTIVGTFDTSVILPKEVTPTITAEAIIREHEIYSAEYASMTGVSKEEHFDLVFGIGLTTELEVS